MILTDEQQAAINAVEICRKRGTFHTFLLRGVTGSGKTEVYLRLTDKALRMENKSWSWYLKLPLRIRL